MPHRTSYTISRFTVQLKYLEYIIHDVSTYTEIRGKVRLPPRDTRQKLFAPCLFYFTVHRSRENL